LSARLKAANVTLIPTLTLFSRDDAFDSILGEVKSYSDVHGQIMFGTDIGYFDRLFRADKGIWLYGACRFDFSADSSIFNHNTRCTPGLRASHRPDQKGDGRGADDLKSDPARDINAFARVALTIRMG
jgi:hypothetical protein